MTAPLATIVGVRIVAADAERLADFYVEAFGCERVGTLEEDPHAAGTLLGIPLRTARSIVLRLGAQRIELFTADPPGAAYPRDAGVADTVFQHIAIVVTDISAATARLAAAGGATAISSGGPQRLPPSSGGVTAYKFRDPEGHPLEFLAFPEDRRPAAWAKDDGPCLGFDHSAIVVGDTAASVAFYARLGLDRTGGSLNTGPEQERLDGVRGAVVEVTALGPLETPPHLELLCYREVRRTRTAGNDVAATQLVVSVDDAALTQIVRDMTAWTAPAGIVDLGNGTRAALLEDPDGHRLLLRATAPGSTA